MKLQITMKHTLSFNKSEQSASKLLSSKDVIIVNYMAIIPQVLVAKD